MTEEEALTQAVDCHFCGGRPEIMAFDDGEGYALNVRTECQDCHFRIWEDDYEPIDHEWHIQKWNAINEHVQKLSKEGKGIPQRIYVQVRGIYSEKPSDLDIQVARSKRSAKTF